MPGANWCTFATWASKQAGQTIRGEDIADSIDDALNGSGVPASIEQVARLAARATPGPTVESLIGAVRRALGIEATLRRAAIAVAAGNLKVFVEIGREFARWLSIGSDGRPPDADATAAFCATLRPGQPPDGQQLLRDAFIAYAAACSATDPDTRAERLLLANVLVGLHEQTRLQPEIMAALDAAIDDEARPRLLRLVFPGFWVRARARLARLSGRPLPLDVALDTLLDSVRRTLRIVLTDTLMTLHVPGAVLHLGRDVRGSFPPELVELDHPALRAVMARVDPTPDSTDQSGAKDWGDLPDRMHFIADLFRCWHARSELFESPYTAAQVVAIRAGQRPAGRL